jgi:uncharacterized protein YegL
MPICPAGHDVREGAKFCGKCGVTMPVADAASTPIVETPTSSSPVGEVLCPNGHPNVANVKFCKSCGVAMSAVAADPPAPPSIPVVAPAASASTPVAPDTSQVKRTALELRVFDDDLLPPEQQVTRNLVVILVDNSGSMTEPGTEPGKTRLDELNDALKQFVAIDMHKVPQLEVNGEIAIGVFAYSDLKWMNLATTPTYYEGPFRYARNLKEVPRLKPTEATTPMHQAILGGLAAVEERKQSLAAQGFVHESRPTMFLITDGESSFPMDDALAALRQAEAEKRVLFFALGVGNANDDAMSDVAPHSYYSLKDRHISECLSFVSGSLSVLGGLNDTAEAMYATIRNANSRGNASADAFLEG